MEVLCQKPIKMNTKNILSVFIVLFCIACEPFGGGPQEGFTFSISNLTNHRYDAELFIGGFQDGVFIATDSVPIPNLRVGYSDVNGGYYIDENRWQPNLEAIRALPSEHAYFKLKLSEEREALIEQFESSELFSLAIPPGKIFIDDEGAINITIKEDKISGDRYAYLETN